MVLALSDERDQWLRRVHAAWREGYQAALSDAVVESLLRICPAPGHVQRDREAPLPPGRPGALRYPRPGDYTGGPVAWNGGRRS